MNSTVVLLIVVGVAAIIAAVAWLLYKANFRAKEIKVKTPVAEFTLDRKPGAEPSKAEHPAAAPRAEVTQKATGGAEMKGNTVKAPAASGARINQQADGNETKMNNNKIELD